MTYRIRNENLEIRSPDTEAWIPAIAPMQITGGMKVVLTEESALIQSQIKDLLDLVKSKLGNTENSNIDILLTEILLKLTNLLVCFNNESIQGTLHNKIASLLQITNQLSQSSNEIKTTLAQQALLTQKQPVSIDLFNASLPTGNNIIGRVGGISLQVVSSFSRLNNTNPYNSGTIISDNGNTTTNLFTIPLCGRTAGNGGIILSALLITNNNTTGSFDCFIFNQNFVIPGDGLDGNIATSTAYDAYVASLNFDSLTLKRLSSLSGSSGNSIYQLNGLNISFKCLSGSTDLFFALRTSSSYTPIANQQFILKLGIAQD